MSNTSWQVARNFFAHALATSCALLLSKTDLILEMWAVFVKGSLFLFGHGDQQKSNSQPKASRSNGYNHAVGITKNDEL